MAIIDGDESIPDWVSLSQLVNWLVLAERPSSGVMDRARRAARDADWEEWERRPDSFGRAKLAILAKLNRGLLTAEGRMSRTPIRPENDWKFRTYVDHAIDHELIPPEAWSHDGIVWVRGSLLTCDLEYADVRIGKADFIRHFAPDSAPFDQASRPPYSTPYLDLMFEAIRELDITCNRQPKHETLVEWFQSRMIGGRPVSLNQAKAMASFVRLTEMSKGGNKKISPV